ncbi:UNKNOWN [Stylonychia lemnae]|uniref:Uncharacterized protein n=1 Tax=Stylonychia lemnae TaxID=5949 RepID=A0A078AGS2_STYLE|nr:UNKNOWN [Stylonychia lemnae]|eukprot:CDW81399.1 UNKNOWN [Stylonychia lemnae]
MNRFMWLNSINYKDQQKESILRSIEAIEFQQNSSMISMIRQNTYNQNVSGLDQMSLVLLKNDLAGTIKSSATIAYVGVFNRFMPNIMSVRQLDGLVYLLFVDYEGNGILVIIHKDLNDIKKQHSLNNSYSCYLQSLYFNPQNHDVYLWGCLESQNNTEAFFGVILHETTSQKHTILYRNVNEYQNQAGFICLGIAVIAKDNIKDPFAFEIFKGELLEQKIEFKGKFLVASYFRYVHDKQDYYHLGQLYESKSKQKAYFSSYLKSVYYSIIEEIKGNGDTKSYQKIQLDSSNLFSFTEVSVSPSKQQIWTSLTIIVIKDLLPYVNLWEYQDNKTQKDIIVSNLSVQHYTIPNKVCYIGSQCNLIDSNYSLVNQCIDERSNQYKFEIIVDNQTFSNALEQVLQNQSGGLGSFQQLNISFKLNDS